MSLDRKKKLQRRKEKQGRTDAAKRDRLRDALAMFGLHDLFDAVPGDLQAQIAGFALPSPTMTLGPSAARLESARHLQEWFDWNLHNRYDVSPSTPFGPSLHDVFCWMGGLQTGPWHRLMPSSSRHGPKARAATAHFVERFMSFAREHGMTLIGKALMAITDEVANQSSPDGHYLYLQPDFAPRGTRFGWNFVIHALEAERRHITLDGASRPVYRCYAAGESLERPEPIFWSPRELGFSAAEERLPVFMQSHAVDACRKRLPPGIFHLHVLSQSLEQPQVERMNDDARLIAYGGANRFGYFVCRLVEEAFVLQTFLFLTMEGTPEYKRVRERLRLRRRDIEELKLDDLDQILFSDLRDDPVLAGVLGECGLSHLLADCADLIPTVTFPGVAQAVRKYLGMPQVVQP